MTSARPQRRSFVAIQTRSRAKATSTFSKSSLPTTLSIIHRSPVERRTRAGARKLYHALRAAFPDFHAIIHWQTVDGDVVTTFKTYHGTHKGSFLGIPATDRKIQFRRSMPCGSRTARSPSIGVSRICFPSCNSSARCRRSQRHSVAKEPLTRALSECDASPGLHYGQRRRHRLQTPRAKPDDYFGLGRRAGSGQKDVLARAVPPPMPTGTPSARQQAAPVMAPSAPKPMAPCRRRHGRPERRDGRAPRAPRARIRHAALDLGLLPPGEDARRLDGLLRAHAVVDEIEHRLHARGRDAVRARAGRARRAGCPRACRSAP